MNQRYATATFYASMFMWGAVLIDGTVRTIAGVMR